MLIKIFTIIIVLATLCQSNKIVTTSLEPIEITDDNYIPLLKNTSKVWLIKFYADWCGACRHFEHEFDEVIREKIKKDKVLKKYTLGKVNVDKAKIVAGTFLLTALPSVFLVDYSNSQVKKVNCRNFNCFKNYLDNIEKNKNFGKEDLVYIYPLGLIGDFFGFLIWIVTLMQKYIWPLLGVAGIAILVFVSKVLNSGNPLVKNAKGKSTKID